jgi:hypothetical protein
MENNFICELCDKSYASSQSLTNHKRMFHSDEKDANRNKNEKDNLYHCRYCDKKSYTTANSRWKHESKCKPPDNTVDNVLEENKKISEENKKLKLNQEALTKTIIKLQNKLIKTTSLTTKSFKSINKLLMERSYYMNQSHNTNSLNTINNNNHIQICNVGSEDILNVLTEQQKKQILNAKFKSIDKLVEIAHCGDYNQFKNIVITNLKDEFAYQYDGSKGFFVTVKKNDIIKDIIDYRIYNINEIYDEMEHGNKIDAKTKVVLQRFMDRCDSDEPFEDPSGVKYPNYKEYKKDCIKILLYNNHERITKDIATLIEEKEEGDETNENDENEEDDEEEIDCLPEIRVIPADE